MPENQHGLQNILQPLLGPRKELHDLTGRTAIITGGALGIGYEVSKAFASVGCRVIMVNRKEDQGESAISEIKKQVGADAQIEWIGCDLGNLKEVKQVFTKLSEDLERLDLVSRPGFVSITF